MNGMNEMITVAKYWQRWATPQFIVLVLNNRDLNQVTWEQRAMQGDPKYPATQDVPDFPAAKFAELIGLRGVRVDNPDDVGAAWDEALAADRPCVVEAVTDPSVPPLPPHITLEQARAMMFAMAGHDPDRAAVVRQSLRAKLAEFLPSR
jgi:pyruvate dehydrogenase (quinone)